MKLLCDACEQVVPLTHVRSEGGAICCSCPRCGAEGRLVVEAEASGVTARSEAPAPGVSPAPSLWVVPGAPAVPFSFDPPENHCPKCLDPREVDANTCPRCGLVFANFVPDEVAPPPALAEAWRGLFQRWEDPKAHDALLLQASTLGALPQLARLYRIRLAQDPLDFRARAGRDQIVGLVTSTPLPRMEGATRQRERLRVIQYGVFAVMMLALLGLLFRVVLR